MNVRGWCGRCIARRADVVAALGVLGAAGFVVATLARAAGGIGLSRYLTLTVGSLAVYAVTVVLGLLGDPLARGERDARLPPSTTRARHRSARRSGRVVVALTPCSARHRHVRQRQVSASSR
jgi:hypothetical protein